MNLKSGIYRLIEGARGKETKMVNGWSKKTKRVSVVVPSLT